MSEESIDSALQLRPLPPENLDEIGLFEFLDIDQRPTFVIDLSDTKNQNDKSVNIVRSNLVFRDRGLVDAIRSSTGDFKAWITCTEAGSDTICIPYTYSDLKWTSYTLRQRWRFICGDGASQNITCPKSSSYSNFTRMARSTSESILTTTETLSPDLRSYLDTIRSVDWASSPLGPLDQWPDDLHQMFTFMMIDIRPTSIFWGPENTIIYNLGYVPMQGARHPRPLGKSAFDAWPDAKEEMERAMKIALATGKPFVQEDAQFFLIRSGYLEECYFTWSLVPLIGPTRGWYNPANETTAQILSRRRYATLRRIGDFTATAKDTESFWNGIIDGLSINEYDCPFAVLYSVGEDTESDSSSNFSGASFGHRTCFLEGTLGIPSNHPAVPPRLDLRRSSEGFAPCFREAVKSGKPMVLDTKSGTLPEELLKGVEWRGFGEPCTSAVLCPIRPSTGERVPPTIGENVTAFLLLGLNTRRAYDEDYEQWILLLSRQLATSAASIAMFEQEVRSGMDAAEMAAREKAKLSDELEDRTKEAADSYERLLRFRRMAESALVGMFDIEPGGKLIQANNIWFEMTGHTKDLSNCGEMSFMQCVYEEDLELAQEQWDGLVEGTPCTFEMRFKGTPGSPMHVLASALPVFGPDGTVTSISGCITDINASKKNEQDAQERVALTEQLLAQKTLAEENERRFTQFAQYAPIAFSILDPDGLGMQFCNEKWYELTGHPRVIGPEDIVWQDLIVDQGVVNEAWKVLLTEKTPQTFEFRLRRTWSNVEGAEGPTWIQAMAFPELSKDGTIKSVMGCMNDISQFKWAESVQKLRTEEALESKRQQENFIDMTSHEMRNPLSAIVQCSDAIVTSLTDMLSLPHISPELHSLIDGSFDAVHTILSCASHQKRIVDDILVLSKLDSNLLMITPVNVQPVMVLHDAFKMFEVEAQRADVELRILKDQSVTDLAVNWVMMDPSRVLQILINLLTNAIKFTATEKVRKISLTLGASVESPAESGQSHGMDYIPARTIREDLTLESDWGDGDVVYMCFAVEDTGCGLDQDEKVLLFNRFSQASHRTHVKYGGSGLGLFISRELTELQGGEIGVVSQPGVGSTFGFFVKTRRSTKQESKYMGSDASPTHNVARRMSDAMMATQFNVLVVEDNLVNQKVLKKQLRKLGYQVNCANHGAEALEFIQTTTYWKGHEHDGRELSIVLLDIEMPVMDGLTCVRRIRELQGTGDICGHIPVIAVSANARIEQINTAKNAGMDDVISKPFRIPELIPKMERLVRLSRG